ncbi:MAG: NAD(P)-dependent alcohol dehydrogenase, partial [Thermoleophilaceae bacterium]|nr:NAD(P)-dependent alcohol dehydrogenase [Thermoleophilaceae bacterium]
MKSIRQDRYGSSDVLRLDEVATPAAGADEVLVRVQAAGVGPEVWHIMSGRPYFVRLMGFGL